MRTTALAAAVAASALGLAGAGTALAETAAGDASSQSVPTTVQGGNESLSTKLNKSGGVIAPKADVDPGIHAQAPDPHPNSTPVVPPAATGGGTAK